MDPEIQRSLLRRLLEMQRAGTTSTAGSVRRQPIAAYVDSERLARELRVLFRESPLVVGLSADLPECGAYLAIDVADVPVLLVRGEDGTARAFLNSCRHRGSRVAEGRGTAERVFKCQYHAWCYDVHGKLVGQPTAQDAFAEVPAAELGLVPLPTAEIAGLLVVTASAGGRAIDAAHLAGLEAELASHRFDTFSLFAEQQHTIRANWKQPYETFLEAYHVFGLHRTTLAKQLLSTPMLADFFGPHGRGVIMGREAVRKCAEKPESEWRIGDSSNVVYWLFPNAVLSLPKSGHAELWLVYPDAEDPGSCRVVLRYYVPADEATSRAAFWEKMVSYTSAIVLEEDFRQQVKIHEGLRSGSHPGLLFGRNEPAMIHFHERLDEALDAAERSGGRSRVPAPLATLPMRSTGGST